MFDILLTYPNVYLPIRGRQVKNFAENRTSRAAAQVKNALFCIIKANFLNILVY